MFFNATLHKQFELHPQFLGKSIVNTVVQKLEAEVEGTTIEGVGCVVAVISVEKDLIPMGKIDSLTGFVKFRVEYSALVYRPIKNEVLDAKVETVTEMGFFVQAGPVEIFVADVYMPEDMEYDPRSMSWKSTEATVELKPGTTVRLRVLSTTAKIGQISAVGSIADPYLGVIDVSD